jgi:5-deoxy-glucuronate isomerase
MALTDTLFRRPRAAGIQMIQQRGADGARELTTRRLILEPGTTATFGLPDEETVVVLQEGKGTWSAGSERWSVARSNVFADRATALYLPPGTEATFAAESRMEAVLISTPAPAGGKPALMTPSEIERVPRGRGSYSREVCNLFVTDGHARRLMVGETINPPGNWSSYPPHKHDGRDGEPRLEEVYYFRLDPAHGFGQQMLYTADGESVTHAVRDGDAVLLPYGYHPVSAPPGYRLYYLWGMAGDERKLALHEDPAHRWIHDLQN